VSTHYAKVGAKTFYEGCDGNNYTEICGHSQPFLLRSLELDEHALISEYLGVLFIQGVPKSAFQSILDTKSYLDPTYAEAMFTAGKITANEW
jgi:hypothetical protein